MSFQDIASEKSVSFEIDSAAETSETSETSETPETRETPKIYQDIAHLHLNGNKKFVILKWKPNVQFDFRHCRDMVFENCTFLITDSKDREFQSMVIFQEEIKSKHDTQEDFQEDSQEDTQKDTEVSNDPLPEKTPQPPL